MKEEEKIENARVKRRNPATEEKIMLNIFKYTIPKETLHFLRFSKFMYYQMGVHPPPIQKLSHGDHQALVSCIPFVATSLADGAPKPRKQRPYLDDHGSHLPEKTQGFVPEIVFTREFTRF